MISPANTPGAKPLSLARAAGKGGVEEGSMGEGGEGDEVVVFAGWVKGNTGSGGLAAEGIVLFDDIRSDYDDWFCYIGGSEK